MVYLLNFDVQQYQLLLIIAEGFKRRGRADKARFMNIAQGSLEESRCYLLLVKDLGYGDSSQLLLQIEEISKLLEAYYNSLLNS